jgi:phosphoglycolate phosphatase
MKYKCIIFDCDGTLVDTLEDIAGSMNQSLAMHGFPAVPVEKYRDIVGWGIIRLATLALPEEARAEETIKSVAAGAQRIMDQQQAEQSLSRPYPGIRDLVAELAQKRKMATAVLSNKPDSVLRRLMADLFGKHAFDIVCGLRPGMTPKPDPQAVWEILAELGRNPHETIFIGDSEIDIETARNSGCYPLGVSWGFRSRATMETAGAARIIDRPEELWDLL